MNDLFESGMPDKTKQVANDSEIKFIGWQEIPGKPPIALYNIIAPDHPLYRSTVSEDTLREHNLPIPATPPPSINFLNNINLSKL